MEKDFATHSRSTRFSFRNLLFLAGASHLAIFTTQPRPGGTRNSAAQLRLRSRHEKRSADDHRAIQLYAKPLVFRLYGLPWSS